MEFSHHGKNVILSLMCAHKYDEKVGADYYYIEHHAGTKDYEIDFVLKDKFDRAAYLFEVKMRQKNYLPANASILKDELLELFPDTADVYRYVVYNGKETVERRVNASGDIREVMFVNLGERLEDYYLYGKNREELIKCD